MVLSFSTLGIAPTLPTKASDASGGIYHHLVKKLRTDGYDTDLLNQLYEPGNDLFFSRLVRVNLVQSESHATYRLMYNKEALRDIRHFLHDNRTALYNAQRQYHVPPEYIGAILYVESRFGKSAGDELVLYVLSSMSVASENWNIQQLTDHLDKQYPNLDSTARLQKIQWIKKRADSKATWAYRELTTLLTLHKKYEMDLRTLRGSWAGAFGMPQFMPSSFSSYAVDGNQDGKIDINSSEDAIASVANYLRRNGWRKHLSAHRRKRVIWRYNHSEPYTNLILDLAKKLSTD